MKQGSRSTRGGVGPGKPAGILRRLLAFLLDSMLLVLFLGAVLCASLALRSVGVSPERLSPFFATIPGRDLIVVLFTYVPVLLYGALCEGSARGATCGKLLVGISVEGLRGGPPGGWRALLRAAVKFLPWQIAHLSLDRIPGWPFGGGEPALGVWVGLVSAEALAVAFLVIAAATRSRRAPHDFIAGTRVVGPG